MTEHLPECQRYFTDMPAPEDCPACGMFRSTWSAALDAAREAVAATFIGWCKDYMNCTDYEHVCGKRREIIAAIDALRRESDV